MDGVDLDSSRYWIESLLDFIKAQANVVSNMVIFSE